VRLVLLRNPFSWPAPNHCRSHEDWIRWGEELWDQVDWLAVRITPTGERTTLRIAALAYEVVLAGVESYRPSPLRATG
jgi:hypothetical protein